MIDIGGLSGNSLNNIQELIVKENRDQYKIYVPKSTQLYFSKMSAIAYDYAYAAYAGQLLSKIGNNFTYEQTPAEVHESIGFTIETSDKQKLAETILEISYLYVNDREDPNYADIEDVNQFLEDVENQSLDPACPYLAQTALEYFKISNEDDEENKD